MVIQIRRVTQKNVTELISQTIKFRTQKTMENQADSNKNTNSNFLKKCDFYLFLQKKGVNKMSTVNSSRRPINIKKEHHHLPAVGML